MKESEIKIGHIYSNDKSGAMLLEKEVVDMWYTYHGKKTNYVKYRIVYANGEVRDDKISYTILKKSFAQWAKVDDT